MTRFNLVLKYLLVFVVFCASLFSFSVYASDSQTSKRVCTENNEFLVRKLDSHKTDEFCATYRGKTILVVNTASRCVYTDQYDGLQKLYQKYRDRGLIVVGFPSNDFNFQEPGNESTIKNFCQLTYNVDFPMYSKSKVVGENVAPIYQALFEASGQRPVWNFHKYLISKDGNLVKSIPSHVEPYDLKLINAIEAVL